MNIYILYYLIFINIVTAFIFWYDKHLSTKHTKSDYKSRISENRLLFFAFLSFGVGAMLSMLLFRHKTKKLSFQAKFWAIIYLEYGVVIYYLTSGFSS